MRLLTLISFFAFLGCAPKKTCTQYTQEGIAEQNNTNSYVAISLFSKAIKLNPSFLQAYEERAATYLSLDSLSSAIRDYDTLISHTSSQNPLSSLFLLKANALYLNSQDSAACFYYRKSRDLNNITAWDKIHRLCK